MYHWWDHRDRLFAMVETSVAGFLSLCLQSLPLWPYYMTPPQVALQKTAQKTAQNTVQVPTPQTLRVAVYNVFTDNQQMAEVSAAVHAYNPDLLLLMEVNPRWSRHLRSLEASYPYSVRDIRVDNFGIMLLSKYPIIHSERFYHDELPSIDASIMFHDQAIQFIGTHPLPPLSAVSRQSRNDQLLLAASRAQSRAIPTIIAGDFNTTLFTNIFQEFCEQSGTRDAAYGFGYVPTWQDQLGPLGMKLDYICVSQHFAVESHRVAERYGSDHNMIIADMKCLVAKNQI